MSIRDQLVNEAHSVEELIELSRDADPDLAQQLEGKGLAYSKTVYAVPMAAILSWIVSKYGLGFDADTQTLIVFLVGTAATWGMRYITNSPITSMFGKVKSHVSS